MDFWVLSTIALQSIFILLRTQNANIFWRKKQGRCQRLNVRCDQSAVMEKLRADFEIILSKVKDAIAEFSESGVRCSCNSI